MAFIFFLTKFSFTCYSAFVLYVFNLDLYWNPVCHLTISVQFMYRHISATTTFRFLLYFNFNTVLLIFRPLIDCSVCIYVIFIYLLLLYAILLQRATKVVSLFVIISDVLLIP